MRVERKVLCRGERVSIRPFQRSDVDAWQSWPYHDDPLYAAQEPVLVGARERDLWYLDRANRSDYWMYAVDDEQGRMIGWFSLRRIDPLVGTSVLGITFCPSIVGRGYGTDTLVAFLGYYFTEMGFKRMYLDVAAYNLRARRCYEKSGFRYIGFHWGDHYGPNPYTEPRYAHLAWAFRRDIFGRVFCLYHDMAVTAAEFNSRWDCKR